MTTTQYKHWLKLLVVGDIVALRYHPDSKATKARVTKVTKAAICLEDLEEPLTEMELSRILDFRFSRQTGIGGPVWDYVWKVLPWTPRMEEAQLRSELDAVDWEKIDLTKDTLQKIKALIETQNKLIVE